MSEFLFYNSKNISYVGDFNHRIIFLNMQIIVTVKSCFLIFFYFLYYSYHTLS